MADGNAETITELLDGASRELEGEVLDEPWVTSGSSFEQDHLDLLVQLRKTREVVRFRVLGWDAQPAVRFGRGDRVCATIQREVPNEEGVVVVEDVRPA